MDHSVLRDPAGSRCLHNHCQLIALHAALPSPPQRPAFLSSSSSSSSSLLLLLLSRSSSFPASIWGPLASSSITCGGSSSASISRFESR
ncbi:uncharacterized protein K489DRAFT_198467 [Dissoconium aciculare CBS 342.82]|uniref:Uncharacterized protein n=1 Tax=Dissoconium aciculare CBS 342.82 TaxID=1314786 RepID=A0A6J3M6J2_9PEZI|nr:uncharacterized protein K489DRAFT_198467 [Dissoconium aciculare CBS 342.82]KAF1823513.1 hypothetical protein K489DRAFT_198467 [Dissoconium aciculare CBS 342.82]